MTKRNKLLTSYLVIMCALTFVRICFAESYFGELNENDGDRLFSTLCQIVCMGIIPIVCYICIAKKRDFRSLCSDFNLKGVKGVNAWLIIIAICILHAVINGGVNTVTSAILKMPGYTSVVSDPKVYLNFGEFLLGALFSAVLPAFFEEITHRGLAYRMSGDSVKRKVILSAILFALMHQNITQTGYTFVGGLMFGALTAITGSIFPAMLAHFINNFFVVIRIYSESTGGLVSQVMNSVYAFSSTIVGAIICSVLWAGAVIGSILLFIKLNKLCSSKKVMQNDLIEEEKQSDIILTKILWVAIFVIGISTSLFSYIWGLLR